MPTADRTLKIQTRSSSMSLPSVESRPSVLPNLPPRLTLIIMIHDHLYSIPCMPLNCSCASSYSGTQHNHCSTNTVTTTGTLSSSGTSTPAQAALFAATTSTFTYAPAVTVHIPPSSPPSAVGVTSGAHAQESETEIIGRSEVHLPIPPPHAFGAEHVSIPLAESSGTTKGDSEGWT
jgi:hypothetical protein